MIQRVLTALVLAPIVLGALFLTNPLPLLLIGVVASFICLDELLRLLRGSAAQRALIFLGFLVVAPIVFPFLSLSYLSGTVIGVASTRLTATRASERYAWLNTVLATLWVICPLAALIAMHQMGKQGATWQFGSPALMAILPLWGGDTAAYFVGKAFGRHLLAPSISPKKTVEGAIANLVVCVVVAMLLAPHIGYSIPLGIAAGLAAGILGQAGDLFESDIKRKADAKDSGTLLPGHGGLLDRIDSLLFTAPAVALILSLQKIN